MQDLDEQLLNMFKLWCERGIRSKLALTRINVKFGCAWLCTTNNSDKVKSDEPKYINKV